MPNGAQHKPHTHTLNNEVCSVCRLTLDQLVHLMLYSHVHTTRLGAWLCGLWA